MKVYTKIVIDMETGEILEEEWFEYEGEIAQCGGGGKSETTSQPLPLDWYMQQKLYPALQQQYSYLGSQYPAATSFEDWLTQQKTQTAGLQSNLAGAQQTLGGLAGVTQNLMTPESYTAAMQPFLNQAYRGIGYSGMPGGSYVDRTLAEAVQQGYMSNLGNILAAAGTEQAQRAQVADIINALNILTGQEYAAKTEPLDYIKAIQMGRYGQGITETVQRGGGGLLGMLF